jgi:DNA modification methylase
LAETIVPFEIDVAGQRVIFSNSKHMENVDAGSVNLVVTSPPYWNLKDYGDSDEEIGAGSYEEYLDDLNRVWDECYRVCDDDAVLVININSRRSKGEFYPIAFDIVARMQGWRFWDHNIWYIPNALPQPNAYRERLLDNKFESLLVFTKGDGKSYHFSKPRVPQKYAQADTRDNKNSNGRCLGNILRIPAYRPPNIKSMGYHVAAFPEELVAFLIESYSRPGNIILDPFLGSGTTLKVARVMGRSGIGYEVHEEYRDLIERRISENWEVPDWKDLDILHSATMKTGTGKPRKAQFAKNGKAPEINLFE